MRRVFYRAACVVGVAAALRPLAGSRGGDAGTGGGRRAQRRGCRPTGAAHRRRRRRTGPGNRGPSARRPATRAASSASRKFPAGSHSLTVASTGFEPRTLLVDVGSNGAAPVSVELDIVGISAQLTVTAPAPDGYDAPRAAAATRLNIPVIETPFSVQVVPLRVIEDQNALGLEEAYANVSGVVEAGNTLNAQTEIRPHHPRVRGGPVPLRNGLRATTVGAVDLINIESVEVLKGPASILYGALEPGGVVNYTTKKPLMAPRYEFGPAVRQLRPQPHDARRHGTAQRGAHHRLPRQRGLPGFRLVSQRAGPRPHGVHAVRDFPARRSQRAVRRLLLLPRAGALRQRRAVRPRRRAARADRHVLRGSDPERAQSPGLLHVHRLLPAVAGQRDREDAVPVPSRPRAQRVDPAPRRARQRRNPRCCAGATRTRIAPTTTINSWRT